MEKIKGDLLGWLQWAVKQEEKGIKFYKKFYEQIQDRNAKELISFLIKAETNHKQAIQRMLDGITQGDEKLVKKGLQDYMKIKAKIPTFKDTDYQYIAQHKRSLMRLFNKAMDLEIELVHYYTGMSLKAEDPMVKKLFKMIANDELLHKQALERLGHSMLGVVRLDIDI